MAHGLPVRSAGRIDPAAVGALLTRLGLALVSVTAPLVVGTAVALLADAPPVAVAVTVLSRAMAGPLVGAGGLAWLFHAGLVALFCGTWLLGAGLLLAGLFD